jgi:hypothetical protein
MSINNLPEFQIKYVADNTIRIRAYLDGIARYNYIVTRLFYSKSAGRWVSEPLSY